MRAYVVTTGIVFALLVAAHLVRLALEGAIVAADPWFLGTTVLSLTLAVWAAWLMRPSRSRTRSD